MRARKLGDSVAALEGDGGVAGGGAGDGCVVSLMIAPVPAGTAADAVVDVIVITVAADDALLLWLADAGGDAAEKS